MFNNTLHLLQDTVCKLNLPRRFQNNIFCRTHGWKGLYFDLSNFNKNYVNMVFLEHMCWECQGRFTFCS